MIRGKIPIRTHVITPADNIVEVVKRYAGSLATPQAMQLAIQEVGTWRILAGCVAAALGRLAGRRGDFYRVAGRHLALIDDVAGTMCNYESYIVLGPRNPQQVAEAIKESTGIDAVVTDVNDAGRVDILGATSGVDRKMVEEALRDNPFGNDDQQTPIVVLKKVG